MLRRGRPSFRALRGRPPAHRPRAALDERPAALLVRYASAVLLMAAAVGARLLLDRHLANEAPFFAQTIAIVFIGWFGGVGPTLVAFALGATASADLFLEPRGSLRISGVAGIAEIGLFLIVGLSSALISEAQRNARRRAESAAHDAQQRLAELQRTQSLLRDSEARAQSILVTAVDAIITCDEQMTIESFNPAAERLFGYRPDEVIGKNVRMLMPSPYREQHDGYVRRYVETGERRIIGIGREVVAQRKDGSTFPMELAVSEMWVGGRRMFTGVVHDITERKRAENALRESKETAERAQQAAEEANHLKDQFLATLSHELRTPLNAIMGWVRLLADGNLDEETRQQAIEVIDRNATAQAQLVGDLLDVSRITSGKLRLETHPVDLRDVVEAAMDSVRPAAEAKGIRLLKILEGEPALVLGDPTRLQQVAWNLLSNSIKFTPRDGRVQVQVRRLAEQVEIEVSDSGKGISPEFVPHMFERFSQADSSLTRAYGGLGLGLAIVRHLTELHGGAVEAHSDGEGKGATFTVRLPVLVDRPQPPWPAPATTGVDVDKGPVLEDLRVLVVDDEPDARALVKAVLERCRARVLTAGSAGEAMALLRQYQPDVLISDLGMPIEDGYSLIRRIRALPPQQGGLVPAIALTAFARAEDRARALADGFQLHATKPVDPAALASMVASLAGGSAVAERT